MRFKFRYFVLLYFLRCTSSRSQIIPYSEYTTNDLSVDIERYINLSMASSAKHTYQVKNDWWNFVELFKGSTVRHCLPASENVLTKFFVYLTKTIKHSSIKSFLGSCSSLPYSSRVSKSSFKKWPTFSWCTWD